MSGIKYRLQTDFEGQARSSVEDVLRFAEKLGISAGEMEIPDGDEAQIADCYQRVDYVNRFVSSVRSPIRMSAAIGPAYIAPSPCPPAPSTPSCSIIWIRRIPPLVVVCL